MMMMCEASWLSKVWYDRLIACRVYHAAHHQVSSLGESQQEADQHAEEYGQVTAVSDTRRHSLSPFKLGSAS